MIGKLGSAHINDLTNPRYIEKIQAIGDKCYKVICDTHTSRGEEGMIISPKFTMDSDLTENINELNTDYHNFVASSLGFDLTLGKVLQGINRSNW